MKRLASFISLVAIFVMVVGLFGAVPAQAGDKLRVFVQFVPGQKAGVEAALQAVGAEFHYAFDKLNAFAVSLPATAIQGLSRNPNIVLIEEDPIREAVGTLASSLQAVNATQTVPYGIDMVQARDVWDVNRDGVVDSGAPTGSNRTVCIIDTGLDITHEDIAGVIVDGYDGNLIWYQDGYGHGTHVAGTIMAMNNSYGVVGVTPGTVQLYIVRVFGDNGKWAYSSTLIDAAYRCQAGGANIISMSLSGSTYSSTENAGFADLYADGILSVAAAGNAGTSRYAYPASYNSVISVAAIDSNMVRASFSQYNDQVELAAPGVAVLSTVPGNLYEAWSGTSMATPHVSGVAALVWSSDTSLTNAEVRSALQASAHDLGATGKDNYYGYGLVQAKDALDLLGGGGGDNTAPTVSITSPANGATFASGTLISFAGSATDVEDGNLTSSLVWTSSRDGQIGTGGSFTKVLTDGTHTITASVTDLGGLTGSAAITVVVQPAAGGTVTVASLTGTGTTINKNFWRATVTATIDPALAGAVVSGAWSSGNTATCTTDASGKCTITISIRISTASITFNVSNVALAGYTYVPTVTSVTAYRP
jgi:hypothetical protein